MLLFSSRRKKNSTSSVLSLSNLPPNNKKNQLPGLGRPMPGAGGMHLTGDAAAAIAAAESKEIMSGEEGTYSFERKPFDPDHDLGSSHSL
jgi:hypothetical protein